MSKSIVILILSVILLAVAIASLTVIFSKKPIPLAPGARLEVKLAHKDPADDLTPITLADNHVGTLYVPEKAELNSSDVAGVYMSRDQLGHPAIAVILTKEGNRRMLSMSSSNIERHVVIFVDGEPISAPRIGSPVSGKFLICGANDKTDAAFRALTQP